MAIIAHYSVETFATLTTSGFKGEVINKKGYKLCS